MTTENEEVPSTQEFKIPKFLIMTYVVVGLIGIGGYFLYWNGSSGWFDRGYWKKLQEAAQTRYPYEKTGFNLEEKGYSLEDSGR